MIYIRLSELLAERNKTKYWFIKNMEMGYQSLSHLINNEVSGIHFDTLEKICNLLECTPGDILVLKNDNNSKGID